MIVQIGDMIKIDPYTEMMDDKGNSFFSADETIGIVIKWYGNSDWQEIELLVSGEILYLKDKWDKISPVFRRSNNVNSNGRRNAQSIRERVDYN